MKQAEKVYLISDAAKQVQVESHVLRYWEEELKLPIKRNEMGHRFYTQEDIERFKEIRDLKDRGLQLKAIRTLLSKGDNKVSSMVEKMPENVERHVVMVNKGEFVPMQEDSREAKSIRLQQLLQNMIAEAVRSNNQEVCEEIKESLLKELDYQFRLQEEREDEREIERISRQEAHYRQIDELLRTRSKKRGMGRNEASKEEVRQRLLQENMQKEIQRATEGEGQKGEEKEKPKKGFLRKKRSIV